jgi:protein-S-isoprenylcysteine O-methyltransferase Ste14
MNRAVNLLGRAAAVSVLAALGVEYFRPLRGGFALSYEVMCGAVGVYCMLMALALVLPRYPAVAEAPLRDRLLAAVCFALPLLMYVPVRIIHLDRSAFEQISRAGYWITSAGAVGGILCILWLGRSYGMVPACRRLVTSGPYRLVRHPFYVCDALILVGYSLIWFSPWTLAIALASLASLLVMARLEERVLRSDGSYEEYCRRVPYRYIPGVV